MRYFLIIKRLLNACYHCLLVIQIRVWLLLVVLFPMMKTPSKITNHLYYKTKSIKWILGDTSLREMSFIFSREKKKKNGLTILFSIHPLTFYKEKTKHTVFILDPILSDLFPSCSPFNHNKKNFKLTVKKSRFCVSEYYPWGGDDFPCLL